MYPNILRHQVAIQKKNTEYLSYEEQFLSTLTVNDPFIYLVLACREAMKQNKMNILKMCAYLGKFLIAWPDCEEGKLYVRAAIAMIYPHILSIDPDRTQLSEERLYKLVEMQLLLREHQPTIQKVKNDGSKKETIQNVELSACYLAMSNLFLLKSEQSETVADILKLFLNDETCLQIYYRFKILFKASLSAYQALRTQEQSQWTPKLTGRFTGTTKDFQKISEKLNPQILQELENCDITTLTEFVNDGCDNFPNNSYTRLGDIFVTAKNFLAIFNAIFPQTTTLLSIASDKYLTYSAPRRPQSAAATPSNYHHMH
ncbi:MAG: hypothetical protein AB7F64_07600 [Gammaproteobacteria bacterium]